MLVWQASEERFDQVDYQPSLLDPSLPQVRFLMHFLVQTNGMLSGVVERQKPVELLCTRPSRKVGEGGIEQRNILMRD